MPVCIKRLALPSLSSKPARAKATSARPLPADSHEAWFCAARGPLGPIDASAAFAS